MSLLDDILDDISSMRDGRFQEKFKPTAVKRPLPQVDCSLDEEVKRVKRRRIEKAKKDKNKKQTLEQQVSSKQLQQANIQLENEELLQEMSIMFGTPLPRKLSKELGDEPLIETVEQCIIAVEELSEHEFIAVDCEWASPPDSIRGQELCLIQVSDPNKRVYLFDIYVGGKALFTEGGLKNLLESQKVLKVFHDCRWDSDVLWNQAGVRLNNVFDTQIGYAIYRRQQDTATPLPVSLNTVLRRFDVKNERKVEARQGMENCADFWKIRPMSELMLQYAREDVLYLPLVYRQLIAIFSKSSRKVAFDRSEKYVDQRRDKTIDELEQMKLAQQTILKEGERPWPKYGFDDWDRECRASIERSRRNGFR